MFLKNKHVIAALIIAPILSVLSYFAVDQIVSEKPHAAKAGAEYALVAKPNCRYASGKCGFKNGEFEVTITLAETGVGTAINLESAVNLDGGKVSLALENATDEPVSFVQNDNSGKFWQAVIPTAYTGSEVLRIVLSAQEAIYYGDTVAAFGHYETTYGKDYR